MKLAIVFVGALVGGAFAWLSLSQVDWGVVQTAVGRSNIVIALLGVPLILAAYWIRLFRWQLMLKAIGSDRGVWDLFAPFFGSFALNNILPLRAGDVARAAFFKDEIGASASSSTASLLVERLLDLHTLIFFALSLMLIAPTYFDQNQSYVLTISVFVMVLVVGCLTTVMLVPRQIARLMLLLQNAMLFRLLPKVLWKFALKVLLAVSKIAKRTSIAKLMLLSFFAWCLEGGVILASILALDLPGAFSAAGWGLVVGNLGTILPGTPGHFGTFHFLCAQMISVSGAPFSEALLAATFAHLVIWGTISAIGLSSLLMLGLTNSSLKPQWVRLSLKSREKVD